MELALEQQSAKQKFTQSFTEVNPLGNLKVMEAIDDAKSAIAQIDFPNRKTEYWKYTRVAALVNKTYNQNTAADAAQSDFPAFSAYKVVFTNGVFNAEQSVLPSIKGVTICALSEAFETHYQDIKAYFNSKLDNQNHIFSALNTAYHTGGIFVKVDKNTVVEEPIELIQQLVGAQQAAQVRNLIIVEENAQVKFVSTYQGSASSENNLTNNVNEIYCHPYSNAQWYTLQHIGDTCALIETTQVYQEQNSTFSAYTISLKGKLIRNNMNVEVDAEHCETNLFGVYLTKGSQHVDNHTLIDHKKPNCNSNELYKGIMNESSTGVFNGKVFVRPDAQKTNAFQSNQNILLTDKATINTKPELEIYADDVKCSHGSTTGQMDDVALFYLQSRGISKDAARKLLVAAFANDVIEKVTIDSVREALTSYIEHRYEH